jgi:hypothetical protein
MLLRATASGPSRASKKGEISMNETETALGATVTAVLTDDEAFPAHPAADIVSPLPATSCLWRDRYRNEEFFHGFFSGPRQHRRGVIGTGNGTAALSAGDVEALLRAALLADDTEGHGPGTHRHAENQDRNEQFFSAFWEGPRQHRSRLRPA